MSLATRVAALATWLGQLLRIDRASFAPTSAVDTHGVTIRRRLGLVTVEGTINLAAGMASGAGAVNLGTVPTGFRPLKQAGAGAYFFDPTGGPGAVLVTAAGAVHALQYSGLTRKALAFSITYEAA